MLRYGVEPLANAAFQSVVAAFNPDVARGQRRVSPPAGALERSVRMAFRGIQPGQISRADANHRQDLIVQLGDGLFGDPDDSPGVQREFVLQDGPRDVDSQSHGQLLQFAERIRPDRAQFVEAFGDRFQ